MSHPLQLGSRIVSLAAHIHVRADDKLQAEKDDDDDDDNNEGGDEDRDPRLSLQFSESEPFQTRSFPLCELHNYNQTDKFIKVTSHFQITNFHSSVKHYNNKNNNLKTRVVLLNGKKNISRFPQIYEAAQLLSTLIIIINIYCVPNQYIRMNLF